MNLKVELLYSKEDVLKNGISGENVVMLSGAIGNWMTSDEPMFTKQELLAAVEINEKIFVLAVLHRVCDCGNYNDYDKFFELIANINLLLRLEILVRVVQGFNTRRSIDFVGKCQRMLDESLA